MADLGDIGGVFAYLQSFVVWQVVGQAISTLLSPAFNALQQDALKAHPNLVITPDILARAVTQTFMDKAAALDEAAKSGLDSDRFNVLLKLAEVRIQPADLAEAVLRSYLAKEGAADEAQAQGVTPDRFNTMILLAGDGIGPQQAAEARRRGIIDPHGKGPDSTSYDQAIAESRLHDKWGPALFELTKAITSPQDAAQAVVRNFTSRQNGIALAALAGVDEQQFALMVDLAGDAPSPTDLTVALRRKLIPEDSHNPDTPGFVQGIQQGRLADKWIPMIKALAQEWPTPVDALEARLVGQITTEESKALYEKFGGAPEFWQLLFNTRGESPTPLELGVIANRGVIPWEGLGSDKTTFQQGFFEGRWRDKWLPVYRELAKFRPPESTITLFLSHGVIDDEQASDMFATLGMTPEIAKLYIDEAHLEAYSDYRGATISQVLAAYHDQIITREQALPLLTGFHVTRQAAEFMVDFEDAQRAFAAVNNAISRIRTLYAGRKITQQTARDSLDRLGIDGSQIEAIVKSWQIENSVSVKVLTQAEITEAFKLGFMTEDEALTELENIGYTPYDAWILLSLKEKALVKGKPKQGPAPPQGQVIPGTT